MDIEIKRDKLDGSDWIQVRFTAILTGYDPGLIDHDAVTELQLIRHKHNLNGGDIADATYNGPNYIADHLTLYIENPTPEFETDLQCWLFKT